jgi:hypothetical protein
VTTTYTPPVRLGSSHQRTKTSNVNDLNCSATKSQITHIQDLIVERYGANFWDSYDEFQRDYPYVDLMDISYDIANDLIASLERFAS